MTTSKKERYRLDKSAFSVGKSQDERSNVAYWLTKSPMERLNAAWYLTCQAYNLDPRKEHKLDRSHFSCGKRN